MTTYFDRMRELLERHGGTVEKYIGDAIVAVFGIPEIHEDDALRAVRAAVEMRTALDSTASSSAGTASASKPGPASTPERSLPRRPGPMPRCPHLYLSTAAFACHVSAE